MNKPYKKIIFNQIGANTPLALTKQTIIEKISKEMYQYPAEVKDTVEHLLETMKSPLVNNETLNRMIEELH